MHIMLSHQRPWQRGNGAFRAGFTLIELLVVMGIIGILASILLPTMAKAKIKAKETASQNALRQMALGFRMFVDENEDTLPETQGSTITATTFLNPTDPAKSSILNYIGGSLEQMDKFFLCPMDNDYKNRPFSGNPTFQYSWSFSQNSQSSKKLMSEIKDPQTFAVLGEEAGKTGPGELNAPYYINDPYWRNDNPNAVGQCGPDVLTVRHCQGTPSLSQPSADVLFADWHVGRLSRNDGLDPRYVHLQYNQTGTTVR